MILTISGLAGSGKSTIGKALAKRLGFNYYDIGDLRKQMAKDNGMTIEDYNKLGETESYTDKDADKYTQELARTRDNFVIQGRLAYHFIPKSVKIFLRASMDVAAKRVFNDKVSDRSSQKKVKNVEEQKKQLIERDASDIRRYKKHYGIDNYTDPKHYDFILDTTNENKVEKNVDKIMAFLHEKKFI
jgi:cytidylate kinase